jgi:hypothetical protein
MWNFQSLEIDNVEADVGVAGIGGMAVLIPARGMNVNFEVATNTPFFFSNLQDGVEEVGASFKVPVAGMLYVDGFACGGFELSGA